MSTLTLCAAQACLILFCLLCCCSRMLYFLQIEGKNPPSAKKIKLALSQYLFYWWSAGKPMQSKRYACNRPQSRHAYKEMVVGPFGEGLGKPCWYLSPMALQGPSSQRPSSRFGQWVRDLNTGPGVGAKRRSILFIAEATLTLLLQCSWFCFTWLWFLVTDVEQHPTYTCTSENLGEDSKWLLYRFLKFFLCLPPSSLTIYSANSSHLCVL